MSLEYFLGQLGFKVLYQSRPTGSDVGGFVSGPGDVTQGVVANTAGDPNTLAGMG